MLSHRWILMLRYFLLEPLRTLTDWWPVQGMMALLSALLASLITRIIEGYEILLGADDWLILGAVTMFILDLMSGVFGALRHEHVTFSPTALKRSGFKAVEWGFIITGSVILAGAAREQGLFLIDQLHIGAMFWLMTTDFISMLHNLKGSEKPGIISGLTALAEGDVGEFIDDAKDAATDDATDDGPNGDTPRRDSP
jgi:hypothetical protein